MSTAFITTQQLSDKIGRSVTADAGGTLAVNAACDAIRTLTEQTITAGTSTVTLDGTGTDCLLLHERPVNTVGTVTINGSTVSSSDYAVRSDGALVLLSGTASLTQPVFSDDAAYTTFPSWPRGRQNIQVTYSHGYGTVPNDLQLVALNYAARLVIQGDAQYETIGEDSIRYAVAATDLTAGEKTLIRKYRRND